VHAVFGRQPLLDEVLPVGVFAALDRCPHATGYALTLKGHETSPFP
jgi:hypothetical protein